jgi:hypothetical protein
MDGNAFEFLQEWYSGQCDGDWEHQYGVEIGTIDNPGWRVRVDLQGTALDGCRLDIVRFENADDDWLRYWSDGTRFEAAAGPRSLARAVEAFRSFALRESDGGKT